MALVRISEFCRNFRKKQQKLYFLNITKRIISGEVPKTITAQQAHTGRPDLILKTKQFNKFKTIMQEWKQQPR